MTRSASAVATEQVSQISEKVYELNKIREMVDQGVHIINTTNSMLDFGNLLNDAWGFKKKLSNVITNERIDQIYNSAISQGAFGGKLLGAGMGGFIMFLARPEAHPAIKSILSNLVHVPISFERTGSIILDNVK